VADGGEVTLIGGAIVEKYLTVPAGSFRRGVSAPAQSTESTFATLLFANNVTHEVYYNLHVPADWQAGTDFKLAIYWTPTTNGAGTVCWEFDWEPVHYGEAIGDIGLTHVDIHDSLSSYSDNVIHETPYGTISGAAIAVDDTIGIKLYRDHDDASDNYAANAAFIHMEIEYYANKFGEAV